MLVFGGVTINYRVVKGRMVQEEGVPLCSLQSSLRILRVPQLPPPLGQPHLKNPKNQPTIVWKMRRTHQDNDNNVPDAPCMDFCLPTLGEKWPHSKRHVGKYSLHGASGRSFMCMYIVLCPPNPNFCISEIPIVYISTTQGTVLYYRLQETISILNVLYPNDE